MLNVQIFGDILGPSGYASHTRLILRALRNIPDIWGERIKVGVVHRAKDRVKVALPAKETEFYSSLMSPMDKPDVNLFIEPCQFYNYDKGVPTIGFMHWETSGIRANDSAGPKMNQVEQLNKCVGVIVSSAFTMRAFASSGVVKPITVIPGPIFELGEHKPLMVEGVTTSNGKPIQAESRPFVVGYMAQWSPRKNIEGFLRTSLVALRGTNSVILLKTYYSGSPEDRARILSICKEIKDELKFKDLPRVIVITEFLSDIEIERFFSTIDLYYAPSRGEGYSIPTAMAVAAGRDVLATGGCGGIEELLGENSKIPSFRMLVKGMSLYEADQYWREIDESHAVNMLRGRYFVENKDKKLSDQGQRTRILAAAGAEPFARELVHTLEGFAR